MRPTDHWLIDKSAFARISTSPDRALWANRIERGLVRVASVTLLEIGFSARSHDDLRNQRSRAPLAAMPVEFSTPRIESRAIEVQELLALQGHRAAAVPDLMIAATAELAGLIVLHVDRDFELISAVTGQLVETLRMD
jgi:predicted nucleic acid-binding protein